MGSSSSVPWFKKEEVELKGINENILSPNTPFHKFHPSIKSPKTCGYELAHKIGEGAFSDVRVAFRRDNDKKVCIKEVNMSFFSKDYVNESTFEFNILSQLSHDSILKVHEVFYSKKVYYIVTDLLHGGELFDSICEREFYTEGDARRVMQTVTEALRYCHQQNVIHRDIKPENLILEDESPDSRVKLIDFGFARVLPPKAELSDLRGSALFVSPEMIKGSYGFSTDVWSLGVVFYIMLSGEYPFSSDTGDLEEVKRKISSGVYSFPTQRWSYVSQRAKDLIAQMLTMDVENRLTMEGVLAHPWMTSSKDTKDVDISQTIATIKQFQKNKRMRATAIAVKAVNLFKTNTLKQKFVAAAKLKVGERNISLGGGAKVRADERNMSLGGTGGGESAKLLTTNMPKEVSEDKKSNSVTVSDEREQASCRPTGDQKTEISGDENYCKSTSMAVAPEVH